MHTLSSNGKPKGVFFILASLKNMAGLVEISMVLVHETGAVFVVSSVGLKKMAEL